IGFDRGGGFDSLIALDLEEALYQKSATVYARIRFDVTDDSVLDAPVLTLLAKYDDGFVAWLNGERVASRNAPESPTWSSVATGGRNNDDAVQFERIDISAHKRLLRRGENVLALQGLNVARNSSDFLLVPEIRSSTPSGGGVRIDRTSTLRARARVGSEWSALREETYAIDSSGLRV